MRFYIITFVFFLFFQATACSKQNKTGNEHNFSKDTMKLKITIGNQIFSASLYDNSTTAAFKKKLPLTIAMKELNSNEKFAELSESLPINGSNPGSIHEGDLMLYGSSTLVLFYESFSTTYNYTRIGRIENATGLKIALGNGNAIVSFEMEK